MNQFNALRVNEPNEIPIEWSIQPLVAHFKSRTSPSNTSPVVSAIMGKNNHCAIDNGNFQVRTSDIPVEFNSESVPYPYIPLIIPIDGDEIDDLM